MQLPERPSRKPFRLAPYLYRSKSSRATTPGDLPVQLPKKFKFIVNRKTAKRARHRSAARRCSPQRRRGDRIEPPSLRCSVTRVAVFVAPWGSMAPRGPCGQRAVP